MEEFLKKSIETFTDIDVNDDKVLVIFDGTLSVDGVFYPFSFYSFEKTETLYCNIR